MKHAHEPAHHASGLTPSAQGAARLRTRLGATALLIGSSPFVACGCGNFDPSQYNCTITGVVDGSAVIKCPNGSTLTTPSPSSSQPSDGGTASVEVPHRRRNVILLIGDGMGYAHQVAASRYRYGVDRGLSFQQFPIQAFVTTWSVDTYNAYAVAQGAPAHTKFAYDARLGYDPALGGSAPYPMLPGPASAQEYFLPGGMAGPHTDSAAAATAIATGFKTLSGVLGLDPDGGILESSAERLRRVYGPAMGVGIVTTAPLSDATPAGFVAHISDRSLRFDIARQMVNVTRPDVVIGAGFRSVTDSTAITEADVETLKTAPDIVYVDRAQGKDGGELLLSAASIAVREKKKLWGLFGGTQYGFEPSIAVHSPGAPSMMRQTTLDPTLPQAVSAALQVLSNHEDGFFLVIEQGSVDKFSHQSDYAGVIGSVADLDDTVRTVLDYVDKPDDEVDWSNTTVIVTADHETGFLRFSETIAARGELPAPETYSWTGDHSNQLVTVSATGAYAHRVLAYTNEYTGLPIMDNTSIFAVVMDANER